MAVLAKISHHCRREMVRKKEEDMRNVSVIGLGAMGAALAGALLAPGHKVTVWNRSPQKAEVLAAKGAVRAESARDAVLASDLVIACLLTYDTAQEALGAAGDALCGRTLVNLTNGTPQQARDFGDWVSGNGGDYLDGGIMAIPPMIGQANALILYSGSQTAFDRHSTTLQSLGTTQYLGADPGRAALYDLSLLAGMYGLFAGAIHATALVGSEKLAARDFVPMLLAWLEGMMTALPEMAVQVDTGDYFKDVVSSLGMQARGYPNLIEASRAQGVSTELVESMGVLMNRAVAAGYGDADIASLVQVISGDKPAA